MRYGDHLSRRDCRSSRRACSSAISAVRTAIGDSPAPAGRRPARFAGRVPASCCRDGQRGARQQVATRTGPSRRAVNSAQGEGRPSRRARAADRGQVTPADQAAARVGQGRARAAARALGVKDRADPLPAVAQAALVADVPAGRRHLEQQGRAVLRRAGQRPRVGQVVQAVEPAAAPAARRGMAAVPHAARVADDTVDAGRAERQPGEAGPGAVRRQHRVRQLVAGERPVWALALGGPAGDTAAGGPHHAVVPRHGQLTVSGDSRAVVSGIPSCWPIVSSSAGSEIGLGVLDVAHRLFLAKTHAQHLLTSALPRGGSPPHLVAGGTVARHLAVPRSLRNRPAV